MQHPRGTPHISPFHILFICEMCQITCFIGHAICANALASTFKHAHVQMLAHMHIGRARYAITSTYMHVHVQILEV